MKFTGAAKRLEDLDLPRIAHEIGVGEDEIHAVLEVESSGSGFDASGRPKILFEPHVFFRNLPIRERPAAVSAGLAYPNWKRGAYPKDSYPRLLKAIAIDETAALKACSWGLAQILGENHKAAGYPTVQAMVADCLDDEDNHLEMMIRFIKAKKLDDELKRHDWAGFARGYNGAGYATHNYHGRLAAAFARWKRIKDTPYAPPDVRESAAIEQEQYEAEASARNAAEPEVPAPAPIPVPPAAPAVPAEQVVGDPDIWQTQRRLKAMNYNPGGLDGTWGGLTAGALTGFINDRGLKFAAPTSPEMFEAIKDELTAQLSKAEGDGYKRPVSDERATASPAKVEQAAPEIVPVRRNWLIGVWGSITAFASAIYNTVSGYIGEAWNFFTDNKDSLPSDPGFVGTAWEYVGKVPVAVWLFAAATAIAVVAYNSAKGMQKITESVQTGERP